MKNILAILAALALFSVSTTVFAGEGPLALPKGADDKAKKHNARVVMCWANRLKKGRGFDLNFEPLDLTSSSDDLLEQVTLMNGAIEDLIRRFPDQYMWSYRRFKSTQSYN